jgi:hypothetical protein
MRKGANSHNKFGIRLLLLGALRVELHYSNPGALNPWNVCGVALGKHGLTLRVVNAKALGDLKSELDVTDQRALYYG